MTAAFAAAGIAGCSELRIQAGRLDTALPSFRGLAVEADRAAIDAATTILTAGGNAADTASAMGLVLSVTLPSRAGLGGGGACKTYDPATRDVLRLDFPARPASPTIDARWRAAVPHMARGFYVLHARAGKLPWAQIVAPAETLARFGFRVSPLLTADIRAGGDTLGNDRAALSLVLTRGRQLAVLGDTLANADLAMTLSRMRARSGKFLRGCTGQGSCRRCRRGRRVGLDRRFAQRGAGVDFAFRRTPWRFGSGQIRPGYR